MAGETKIKISSLSKSFGSNKVLDGIDLEIASGSSLVILGGSGTGKSVLIKTIIGLMEPDSGSIVIDGIETAFLGKSKRFRIMEKYGFLFQGGALFDSLSVEDNITFFAEKLRKLNKKDKRDLAVSKVRSVGLSEKVLNLYPAELSGGMQKRVSLARAICADPEVVFFDEPTTGLDPIMAGVINDLIIKVREELKATTVTITHDIEGAHKVASDLALIYKGKIVWKGVKEDMKTSEDPYIRQFLEGRIKGPMEWGI